MSLVSRGRPKARVLPDPVWARPSTSRPASASGSARAWMANGASIPRWASALNRGPGMPSSRKVVSAGAGTLSAAVRAWSRAERTTAGRAAGRLGLPWPAWPRRPGAFRRPELAPPLPRRAGSRRVAFCGKGELHPCFVGRVVMGGVDDSGELELTEKRTAHTCDRASFSPAGVAASLPAICHNPTSGPLVPPGRLGSWRRAGQASLVALLEVADGNEPGDERDDHGYQQAEFGRADRRLVAQQEQDPPDHGH